MAEIAVLVLKLASLAEPKFSAKNILSSEKFENPMKIEINIVETICNFGHNVFKKRPVWSFFIRIFAISYGKYLATLSRATNWPIWNLNAAR